jgi:hypothetical protein
MPDQQAMQDYVRARMAGTQGPPQPTPDPMQSYVLAQGALGSRVPPTTMMDSPQYLVNPDDNFVRGPKQQSNQDQAEQDNLGQRRALLGQMDDLHAQIEALPPDHPLRAQMDQQWHAMLLQVNQLGHDFQDQTPTGRWLKDGRQVQDNRGPNADTIQNAIQNRQAQPRQPLPPPAPGGVPYAPAPQPVIPQPPATAGLTS